MPAPISRQSDDYISIPYERCWAKTNFDGSPGISVLDHCLNVGCVAEALIKTLPKHLQYLLPSGIATLAALHDIGKISLGFQAKSPIWLILHHVPSACAVGSESDHAKITQFTLQQMIGDPLRFWAAVVGAHHGKVKGDWIAFIAENNPAAWEAERKRLVEELGKTLGPLPVVPGNEALWWLTAGLITVADWIGSDEEFFPQTWTGNLEERRQKAGSALGVIRWERPQARPSLGFKQLFPNLKPNSLQAAVWRNVTTPGLYVIEGPMGCGKTEAALAAAYRLMADEQASGIYFALPTQVTSNRIHFRVEPFLGHAIQQSSGLRLIHSASWLLEPSLLKRFRPGIHNDIEADENMRAGQLWFASAKRAILAPFGVGTVDQALLSIVAAKHFFVRQFGLAGKVVILDEVHTYDLYTSTLIDALIKRLLELRCTVIVLSATLTRARRCQLLGAHNDQELSNAYPLVSMGANPPIEVPSDPPLPKLINVHFQPVDTSIEACLARAQQGECVLWIRNTVDEAQETFGRLKSANRDGGPNIALLHSRFPQFRREELENDWMDRLGKNDSRRPRNGCVLVSTQVAEQSVDIDADLLVTDLAPTDMLLQRLGRLWRHERERPCPQAEIWIRPLSLSESQLRLASVKELRHALGKSAWVYSPYVLLRTWQQWRQRTTITLPDDIRTILEATYDDQAVEEPEAWRELYRDLETRKRRLSDEARNVVNVWFNPALADREEVQTRYSKLPMASVLLLRNIETVGSVSVRLILLNGETLDISGRDWDIDVARVLHQNSVRMPYWSVRAGIGTVPEWGRMYISQSTAVGVLQSSGTVLFWPNNEESGLSYCPERGVLIARGIRPVTNAQENGDEDESCD